MAETAYQTQYRKEFVAGFEKRESLIRKTTITETEIHGNTATFLVADSGGATAVTRGANGDIPTRADNLTQPQATLQEWHDIPERTNFNLWASQGNGREIMQQTCMSVINRKIDEDIRTALSAATVAWGSAQIATLELVLKAYAILGNAFAIEDAPVFALITPAFRGELMQLAAFTSADYVALKPFENVPKAQAFEWMGINFIVDGSITGVGTSSAACLMYSQNAIGHAIDSERLSTFADYDEKNDKSWARCTVYMGSKLLQNAGVVEMPHDDTNLIP